MASSLQDRISQNRKVLVKGPGGVLQETPPEDLQQLTGKAGLDVPPTDAISAGAIGANPHQQKMAGSIANVQNAMRMAQDQNQTLQTAERQQQARSTQTAQEQVASKKSKDLQDLGGLGDRVNQFIEGQKQKLQNQTMTAQNIQTAEPPAGLTGLPQDPNTLSSVKDAAKALLANPNDMQALLKLNEGLGRDKNRLVTPDELKQLYEDSSATLARTVGDVVDHNLQVEDLIAAGTLGYDLPALSGLLELPADQIAKLSVSQLRDQIAAVNQKEFSKSQELQKQAGSTVLGSAERGLARQLGREASATGQRASEHDMSRLEDSIGKADTVSFAGQTMTVEQLLGDDTISKTIKDYLDSPEGSPLRQRIESTEPALTQFIHQNQAALKDVSDQMAAGAGEFQKIQSDNAAVGKVAPGAELDTDVLKSLLPDYGKLSASRIDTSQNPALAYLHSLDEGGAQRAVGTLNALKKDHTMADVVDAVGTLNPDEIKSLELDKGLDSPRLKNLRSNRDKYEALEETSPADANRVLQLLTGDAGFTPEKAQALLDQSAGAKALGFRFGNQQMLDADNDGKLDSIADILHRLKTQNPKASTRDAAHDAIQSFSPKSPDQWAPANSDEATLWGKLKGFVADGKLDTKELDQAKLSEEEMHLAAAGGYLNAWPSDVQTSVKKSLATAATSRSKDLASNYDTTPVPSVEYGNLLGAAAKEDALAKDLEAKLADYAKTGRDWQLDQAVLQRRLTALRTNADQLRGRKDQMDAEEKARQAAAAAAAAEAERKRKEQLAIAQETDHTKKVLSGDKSVYYPSGDPSSAIKSAWQNVLAHPERYSKELYDKANYYINGVVAKKSGR